MQRWLARFSFSFFIFAAVLLWEAYNAIQGRRGFVPTWRIYLYGIAAAMSFALGVLGVRARHREIDP
ncbi:MAG TPA: hypothetical protein VHS31_03005 [Tepidisphaeraceae bacterium]|nr:hypothetical protein [Tepidisphaeraceae bacterium]